MDNNINQDKISFVYKEQDEFKTESLWATKVGNNYRIDNIPFFINNISCGDLVRVEIDNNELFFDSLVEESGNSTIQLIILNSSTQTEIGKHFEKFDCNWEGTHISNRLSVDIPKYTNYSAIKLLLEKGSKDNVWDYKESCLSTLHRSQL